MTLKIFQYEDCPITFRQTDGLFISANDMAKKFGKKPNDWLRLPSTVQFLKALAEARESRFEDFVQVERGGSKGGVATYLHEDAAIEFARWLSPAFAIWCNDRIKELLKIGVTAINPEDLLTPENMIRAMEALKAARRDAAQANEQLQLANRTILAQAPKVEYCDKVLSSNTLLTTNKVAADLGMSAVKLNRILQAKKIVYSQSGTYMLYANYRDKGLADYKTHHYLDSTGKACTAQHLYWTEAGRKFIIERLQAA